MDFSLTCSPILKDILQVGDLYYKAGDFVEELADQMQAKGLPATRTAATEVAAATAVNVVKIANPKSYVQTWERCPSRLTSMENKHWPVNYPKANRTRPVAHCKMPDCIRQIRSYCRECDVPLCIEYDDHGGKTCFEKFHTKKYSKMRQVKMRTQLVWMHPEKRMGPIPAKS